MGEQVTELAPRKTGVYDGRQRPARQGVYERNYGSFTERWFFCYWDGQGWCFAAPTAEGAIAQARGNGYSARQYAPWRGIDREVVLP